MDEKRARELLRAERARVEDLLRDAEAARRSDLGPTDEVRDTGDQAQELTAEGTDEALAASLKDRLAALDRAEHRLANGTFGRLSAVANRSLMNGWRLTRLLNSP